MDLAGLRIEAVVVDNGGRDHTRHVTEELAREMAIRYLYEPTLGNYGKSHALNCALDAGGLGDIVAVLDDDMSVDPAWSRGVMAISRRWPNTDLFAGRSYVIWPAGPRPIWVHHSRIQSWMFSVQNCTEDTPLKAGHWFSGNHFWFRSRVIEGRRRFEDSWMTEPNFTLQLVAEGHCGIQGPDAIVGHRVQMQLLDPTTALRRAQKCGALFAASRLDPRFKIRHSRLARQHPFLARAYTAAQWVRWRGLAGLRSNAASDSMRFGDRLVAVEREANFRATWRLLSGLRKA